MTLGSVRRVKDVAHGRLLRGSGRGVGSWTSRPCMADRNEEIGMRNGQGVGGGGLKSAHRTKL